MTRAREILDDLKRRKRSIDIAGQTHWIVEGDLVLNESRLEQYAIDRAEADAEPTGEKKRGLVATVIDGRILRWRPGKVLGYTVVRGAFASQECYDRAVRDMRLACKSWEAVCDVHFKHEHHLDANASVDGAAGEAVFRVRQLPGVGGLIASAFFPDWQDEERWVNLRRSGRTPRVPPWPFQYPMRRGH